MVRAPVVSADVVAEVLPPASVPLEMDVPSSDVKFTVPEGAVVPVAGVTVTLSCTLEPTTAEVGTAFTLVVVATWVDTEQPVEGGAMESISGDCSA